jgi:hypothetical protein
MSSEPGTGRRGRWAGVVVLALVSLVFPAVASLPTLADSTFSETFRIFERGNLQGITQGGGSLWACFDTGEGKGRIVRYSTTGAVLTRSPELPLGHCAEIAYRTADHTIYAVDYVPGGTTAHVRVVDMGLRPPAVVRTFDVAPYGLGQMVAIDNVHDRMLLKTGVAPYRFHFFAVGGSRSETTIRWLREVRYRPRLGRPQGLEVVGDEFLFLTSHSGSGSTAYNRIHSFSLRGTYKGFLTVPIARESEGLALDRSDDALHFGLHGPAAVYELTWPRP